MSSNAKRISFSCCAFVAHVIVVVLWMAGSETSNSAPSFLGAGLDHESEVFAKEIGSIFKETFNKGTKTAFARQSRINHGGAGLRFCQTLCACLQMGWLAQGIARDSGVCLFCGCGSRPTTSLAHNLHLSALSRLLGLMTAKWARFDFIIACYLEISPHKISELHLALWE